MDKILINNMQVNACHGCLGSEKINPQLFEFDLELECNLSKSMKNDNIDSTINYSSVVSLVKDIVENNTFNLLEKLGNVIINEIFEQFPVNRVKINIRKPDAKIDARFDYVGIEIARSNEE